MSDTHTHNIENLKHNFDNLMTIKSEIMRTKSKIEERLNHLKANYNELLKANNNINNKNTNKKLMLFCLDSFFFQYKTFTMEMEYIDKTRALTNNRIYCDYYKLYNIILMYIRENRPDTETKTYPVYKDLEPFYEYNMSDVHEIHDNILSLLNMLYLQAVSKKSDIDSYNETHHVGFSISNFLNTLEYENRLLKEQITLYINYLSFFHVSQKRQLDRIYNRITEFYKEVECEGNQGEGNQGEGNQGSPLTPPFLGGGCGFGLFSQIIIDRDPEFSLNQTIVDNEDVAPPLIPPSIGETQNSTLPSPSVTKVVYNSPPPMYE